MEPVTPAPLSLVDRWQQIDHHVRALLPLLLETPDGIAAVTEFLDYNEVGLAIGVLANILETHRVQGGYQDMRFAERACDACGKLYRGPAVYCSLSCAQNDA